MPYMIAVSLEMSDEPDFFLLSSHFLSVLSFSSICYYIVYQLFMLNAKIIHDGTKTGQNRRFYIQN